MRLIIDRDAGTVDIDGKTHAVDMVTVQPEIVRVVWLDDTGTITYRDGKQTGMNHWSQRFKTVVDLWYDQERNELRTR